MYLRDCKAISMCIKFETDPMVQRLKSADPGHGVEQNSTLLVLQFVLILYENDVTQKREKKPDPEDQ